MSNIPVVFINVKEKDARDGTEFDLTVGILKAGDCFGVSQID